MKECERQNHWGLLFLDLSELKAQKSRPLVSISKYILKTRGQVEYACYG
jgi:hypothetical protein